MTLHRAIHGLRNRLGLDEDSARDLYEQVTGKRQLSAMSEAEMLAVKTTMAEAAGPAPAGLPGPYGKKLQALWISAYRLGVVRDRRDSALLAFLKRQTGIEHPRFLREAGKARAAVEALKAWLAREGGVDWGESGDPAECVARAIARRSADRRPAGRRAAARRAAC